ncbi:ABC transporter permease [Anaerocolumna chitinilytica]|jgi:putative ABC transport system permease protein|uniref:ABC transporter permease n=1 Tax=Anaerocolumna chitinilytica TaxID=1727145 RepID=A0A7I8DNY3_9FIRM|nr:ABC transporter permease [Anaerocolumna chitinilytica]BCK00013.1 ABC transporter permease [Anaerocolumna chitinilytica]
MNPIQVFKLSWSSIVSNKMRSFLTMLGMIIGVASVIIMVSLMQGMTREMKSSFGSMGVNNVTVNLMGRNGDVILTEKDMYDYAKKHKDTIKAVMPNVGFQTTIKGTADKMEGVNITGVDEQYAKLNEKELDKGSFINYMDVSNLEKTCVIGSYIDLKVFKQKAEIGDILKIDGEEYIIKGILKETADNVEWSEDNCIYIPYTTAARQARIGSIGSYSLMAKDTNLVEKVTSEINDYLFKIYHDKKFYSATNLINMLKEINLQLGMMTALLAGIAGISLLVAGIGIMNIMLVSVTERTREIGIRKSLGAKKRDIMRQFVMEAGMTSGIGGIAGILLGAFASIQIGNAIGFNAAPSLSVVLISFGISAGIGITFGYLPANKAAKLNPIEALRSE